MRGSSGVPRVERERKRKNGKRVKKRGRVKREGPEGGVVFTARTGKWYAWNL